MKKLQQFFQKYFGWINKPNNNPTSKTAQQPDKNSRKKAAKVDKGLILWTVEHTDKVRPGASFRNIAPIIHHFRKALEFVNHYGNLSSVYCEELVKRFEDDFPLAIEQAIINLEESHLIYYLTDAGHTWSTEASTLMQEKHQLAYEHNIEGKLPPKEALIFLADQEMVYWYDIRKKINEMLLYHFRDKGYVVRYRGDRWGITYQGKQQADIYRQAQSAAT